MKKLSILATVLVLTAVLLSGCRSSTKATEPTKNTTPSTMPTMEMTIPTMPEVMPDATEGTEMMPSATGSTEATTDGTDVIDPPESRSRSGMVD